MQKAALKAVYLETKYVKEAAERRRDETTAIMHLAQYHPQDYNPQLYSLVVKRVVIVELVVVVVSTQIREW